MARGAADTGLDMRIVREAGVIWKASNELPIDRLLTIPRHADLFDFGLTLANGLVAGHA
jgi:hypothetical protein